MLASLGLMEDAVGIFAELVENAGCRAADFVHRMG